MRLVFAHDHIFKKDKFGNYYTAGSFNNDVWKRYLKHFDEVIVIARLDSKPVEKENKYNKFNLKNCSFQPIPSLSGPITQFKNRSLAKTIIKNKLIEADALIARLPSEIGNLAIDVANELGKPYAIEVVACVWDALWNYGSIQAKIYAPIAMYKMKKRVKNSPYTLYVTNKFLQKRYPSNGESVSVSNVEIPEVSDKCLEARLKKIRSKSRLSKIGMIGNLNNRIKGWDTAIRALEILAENNIDFELHILGDGNKTRWEKIAKELDVNNKVFFHGVLPSGGPVFKWLDDIDIYIQPSFQEGLPRAVIEAMSRGCPVIGSTAGGIPELIDQDCLHKPGDYKRLGELLLSTMLDIKKAEKISVTNFKKSKLYKKELLDNKRSNFWSTFVEKTCTDNK